jgi:hypothetical protein
MTTIIPNMAFPTLIDAPILAEDGKSMHPVWLGAFQQLFQVLQSNLTPEGIITPGQSASNIVLLANSAPGTLLYNKDTNKGMLNENGVFKTITTS